MCKLSSLWNERGAVANTSALRSFHYQLVYVYIWITHSIRRLQAVQSSLHIRRHYYPVDLVQGTSGSVMYTSLVAMEYGVRDKKRRNPRFWREIHVPLPFTPSEKFFAFPCTSLMGKGGKEKSGKEARKAAKAEQNRAREKGRRQRKLLSQSEVQSFGRMLLLDGYELKEVARDGVRRRPGTLNIRSISKPTFHIFRPALDVPFARRIASSAP